MWCVLPGKIPSVFPPPLPPTVSSSSFPPSSHSFSTLLFLLSVTCVPPSSYFTPLSSPPHFFLPYFSSLPSLPPFLSSFPLIPKSLPPFPLQTDEVKNVRWCTSGGVMIYFDRFGRQYSGPLQRLLPHRHFKVQLVSQCCLYRICLHPVSLPT